MLQFRLFMNYFLKPEFIIVKVKKQLFLSIEQVLVYSL